METFGCQRCLEEESSTFWAKKCLQFEDGLNSAWVLTEEGELAAAVKKHRAVQLVISTAVTEATALVNAYLDANNTPPF